MKKFMKEFIKNEDGLNTLEYIVLAFGILVIVIVAVKALGGTTNKKFQQLDQQMQNS